jgi:hypothetical protein
MAHENVVPIRGVNEDWSGDKEDEVLEKKKDYAKTFIRNQLLGSPDFYEYESFLSLPKDSDGDTQNDGKEQDSTG